MGAYKYLFRADFPLTWALFILINQSTDHVKRVAIATQDHVQGISLINATVKQLHNFVKRLDCLKTLYRGYYRPRRTNQISLYYRPRRTNQISPYYRPRRTNQISLYCRPRRTNQISLYYRPRRTN